VSPSLHFFFLICHCETLLSHSALLILVSRITNYGIEWLQTQGPAKMFSVMAGISAGVILTSVPMYIFGKKYRHFWQHHNLLKMWHLETDKTGAD
jgi:hypothetical protein